VLVQYVTAGKAILVADQRRGLAADVAKQTVGFVERMTEKGRHLLVVDPESRHMPERLLTGSTFGRTRPRAVIQAFTLVRRSVVGMPFVNEMIQ
jgi:hypothetical protein